MSILAADAPFQADVSSEVAQKLQRIVGSSLGNVTAAAKRVGVYLISLWCWRVEGVKGALLTPVKPFLVV